MHRFLRILALCSLIMNTCIAQVDWIKEPTLPAQFLPSSIFAIESSNDSHFVIGSASVGAVTPSLAISGLNVDGSTRWTVTPNTRSIFDAAPPSAGSTRVVVDTDGHPVILFACPDDIGNMRHCVTKLSRENGTELWRTIIPSGTPSTGFEVRARLVLTQSGGFFVETEWRQVTRLSSDGHILWSAPETDAYSTNGVPLPNGDWVYATYRAVKRLSGVNGALLWTYDAGTSIDTYDAPLLPQDDGSVVLRAGTYTGAPSLATDRLIKITASGQAEWNQEQQVIAIFRPPAVRMFQVGQHIVRTFISPSLGFTISATNLSGVEVWHIHPPESQAMQMGGQIFLQSNGLAWTFSRLDAQTGALQTPVQFPVSFSYGSVLASNRYVLFSNTDTYPRGETAIEAFALDAARAWTGRLFRGFPVAGSIARGARECQKPSMVANSDESLTVFAYFAQLPDPSQPQQDQWTIGSAYRLRYSSAGALLEAQRLGEVGCPPASYPNGDSIVSKPNDGAYRISSNGTVQWHTRLSGSSSTLGRTYVLSDGSAIVQESLMTWKLSSTGDLLSQGGLLFPSGGRGALADAFSVGASELVAVDFEGRVFRTDGITISWMVNLAGSGCEARTMRMLRGVQQSVVVFNDCEGAKIARISDAGVLLWRKPLASGRVAADTTASAAVLDGDGNTFVAGCTADVLAGSGAQSLIQAFDADGSTKWVFIKDVVLDAQECPSAIAALSSGQIYATVNSSRATHNSHLLHVTSKGEFEGVTTHALEGPAAAIEQLIALPNNHLAAVGSVPFVVNGPLAFLPLSLRSIQATPLAQPWRIAFAPPTRTEYRYGDPITLTLRLQQISGSELQASQPVNIRVLDDLGAGHWVGTKECVVPIGSSSCEVIGRWSKVESAFSLRAESDGVPNASSATFSLLPAITTVTMSIAAAPYTAWDTLVVDIAIYGAAPVEPLRYQLGRINLGGGFDTSCASALVYQSPPLTQRCTIKMQGGETALRADFDSETPEYASAHAELRISPVARALPVITVGRETNSSTRLGDRTRLFVKISVGQEDVTPLYFGFGLSAGCENPLSCRTASSGYFGGLERYFIDVPALALGTLTTQVQFLGNNDLLPASSNPIPIEVIAGAGVRGYFNVIPAYQPRFCATASGVTCALTENAEFFCDVPLGWTGDIYPLTDSSTAVQIIISNSPIRIFDAQRVRSGVQLNPVYLDTQFSGCRMDVDGDGTLRALTDGIVILRAMLGLRGQALLANSEHACVPLGATERETRATALLRQPQFNPSGPIPADIDGDGRVDVSTDGLLLLRALLGFRGTALTEGALAPSATRREWWMVMNYLYGCGVF